MKQKFLLTLMALIAAFSAHADSFTVDGINYTTNGDEATVARCQYSGDLVIPETVTYDGVTYTVTAIGNYAFSYCNNLKSATIPNSITSIRDGAFMGCSALETVMIDNASTPIGFQAFTNCYNLTTVDLGNAITSIDTGVFINCFKLLDVEIPNTVISINRYAFNNCVSMTNLRIPGSVTFIDKTAFQDCANLTSITVDSNNPNYDSRDNCNALIETSTNMLITGSSSTIIPNSITSINDYAFSSCQGLTNIRIPNSVITLGNWAFSNCKDLTGVTIGNSVTSIGEGTFHQCYNLKHVSIGSAVTTIGEFAFNGCSSLKVLTIPNSVTTIGDDAFQGCDGLTGLTINSDLTLSQSSFNGCNNLTNFTIGESVTSIDASNFGLGSNLKNVTSLATTPPTCTSSFPNEVYWRSSLSVPEESISAYESADCWMNFSYIYSINNENTEPEYPQSDIWGYPVDAFLYDLTYSSDDPMYSGTAMMIGRNYNYDPETDTYSVSQIQYDEWNTDSIFYVPEVIETQYGNFKLTHIGEGFSWQTDIKTVYIPPTVNRLDGGFSNSSLESIIFVNDGAYSHQTPIKFGEYATFQDCERLTTVEFERPIDNMPFVMFMNCSNLKSINIYSDNKGLDTIANCAFLNCTGLTHFDVPNTVKVIGGGAFAHCHNLESIYLPDGLTTIGDYAFAECNQLKNVTLNSSIQSIGDAAFLKCWSLTSISIPDNMTTVNAYTFYDCKNLTDLDLNNVTVFKEEAFAGCTKLTSIDLTKAQSIGEAAFFGGKVDCTVWTHPDDSNVSISSRVEEWGRPDLNLGSLKNITLGEDVSLLNERTFYGHILDTITCMAPAPPIFSRTDDRDCVFSAETYDTTVLRVPQVLVNDYREAYGWSRFTHILGIAITGNGDANGDGQLTISDVTALIDMLLGGPSDAINPINANVNGDENISIGDITALIDLLLSSGL